MKITDDDKKTQFRLVAKDGSLEMVGPVRKTGRPEKQAKKPYNEGYEHYLKTTAEELIDNIDDIDCFVIGYIQNDGVSIRYDFKEPLSGRDSLAVATLLKDDIIDSFKSHDTPDAPNTPTYA